MYFMSNICFLSVHTSLHVCTSVSFPEVKGPKIVNNGINE